MLNDDKTEFLLVGSRKQRAKLSIDSIRVGDCNISPSQQSVIWANGSFAYGCKHNQDMQRCILLSL